MTTIHAAPTLPATTVRTPPPVGSHAPSHLSLSGVTPLIEGNKFVAAV